jgi:hypothetical protein
MFTMSERAQLLARIRDHLAGQHRPLRPERVAGHFGLEWLKLSQNDRRVIAGIMSRLGWRPTEGAKWERAEVEAAA